MKQGWNGFTLIDVLIGSFLVSIIFVGIFGVFQLGFRVVAQGENRIVATNIANEKMEIIRTIPYASVGVIGAELPYVAGELAGEETINRNGRDYIVETKVKYIIDSADGLGAPEDVCPYDYKRVQVKVAWSGFWGGDVVFLTDIAPGNLAEECSETGSVLGLTVFDAYGVLIDTPLMKIIDPTSGEIIDSATPSGGRYYFPLSPGYYKAVVSKDGYSSARTYGDDEIIIPENPHPRLEEGEVVEIGFSIDRLSAFSVNTVSRIGAGEEEEIVPVGNVEFNLRGEKIIGYNGEEEPVYKYSKLHITDASGHIDISDMEWDDYFFSIDPQTNLVLEEISPSPQPVALAPDTLLAVDLFVRAEDLLLVKVEDAETQEPIFSAEVELYNESLLYNETQDTNEKGETYFIPLEPATYNFSVAAPGYNPLEGTVSVSGVSTKIIQLERIE